MSNLTNTKSLLAKLLASENLTIEHGNYPTASMDVKNRILRLPIWKEMSGSLYDLMVLHEVGHALYTPEDGWHESASSKGSGYKSFLNVVEDARIERKIKDKYPGGRRAFVDGYLDLIRKDFFGLNGLDPNELNLIDRINLHFKGGSIHGIEFSEEESEFVEKVKGTRTWEDVVRVADELYEYAKDHDSETDMSDHSMMSMSWDDDENEEEDSENDWNNDGSSLSDEELSEALEELNEKFNSNEFEAGEEEKEDSGSSTGSGEGEGESEEEGKSAGDSAGEDGDETDNAKAGSGRTDKRGDSDMSSLGSGAGVGKPVNEDYKPRSMTDDNFRSREEELVEVSGDTSINYGNLPIANLKNIIIDYKEIHKIINDYYIVSDENTDEKQLENAAKAFIEFRNKNKKTVEYLAKEFEMKKAADSHSRTATANSGIIDTNMLHTYKYNEHIFKKINVTFDGKNHGLVMVVDWSGSMGHNIKGTIEQMMILVMFAKRVNIPFEVFLFSDSYPSEYNQAERHGQAWTHKDNGKNGDLIIDVHHLLNVFSSRMRANEIHSAYVNMTAIAQAYDRNDYYGPRYGYRSTPRELCLGGTPLNGSLLAINTFVPEFKAKNNVQIVNLIYLTDGDSSGGEYVWDRRTEMEKDYHGNMVERAYDHKSLNVRSYGNKSKVIIRDLATKYEYEMDNNSRVRFSRGRMTNLLVEVLRNKHGVNVVNFLIHNKLSAYDALDFVDRKNPNEHAAHVLSKWRKEGHVIAENYGGWSELYLIKGGRNLDVHEPTLEVKEDAKKGEIKRAFSKFNKGKLKNRLLLSKFVDMIAA